MRRSFREGGVFITKPITLKELRTVLKAADKSDLLVEIKEYQDGKFRIPLEVAMLLALSISDSDVFKDKSRWGYSVDSASGATAQAKVTADAIWKIHTIQAQFAMVSDVDNRACDLFIPEIGLGAPVPASMPDSLFGEHQITLPADKGGYIIMTGSTVIHEVVDGVVTRITDVNPLPLVVRTGAEIIAEITANGHAGDAAGIRVIYEILEEE